MGVATGVAACLVGLLGGAWVPFVAYRLSVPAGQASRGDCVSCGRLLPAGWLRLPSRCPTCGTRWGPRVWLTVTATTVSCGLTGLALGPRPELVLYLMACVLGVLLAAIDVNCRRLPHALVVPAIGVSGCLFALVAAATGDWASLVRAVLGAAALGLLFLLLFALPWRGLGLGDVKLAVLLGGYLGWIGWREVLWGALLPWLLNGPVVATLWLTRRVGRHTMLPFGPALLAGALAAILVGASLDLLDHPR